MLFSGLHRLSEIMEKKPVDTVFMEKKSIFLKLSRKIPMRLLKAKRKARRLILDSVFDFFHSLIFI